MKNVKNVSVRAYGYTKIKLDCKAEYPYPFGNAVWSVDADNPDDESKKVHFVNIVYENLKHVLNELTHATELQCIVTTSGDSQYAYIIDERIPREALSETLYFGGKHPDPKLVRIVRELDDDECCHPEMKYITSQTRYKGNYNTLWVCAGCGKRSLEVHK